MSDGEREGLLAEIHAIMADGWTRGRILPAYLGAGDVARAHEIRRVLAGYRKPTLPSVEDVARVILAHEFLGWRKTGPDTSERTCRCGHVITFTEDRDLDGHTRDESMAYHLANVLDLLKRGA